MKCQFCGEQNKDVNRLRDHMTSHVDKFGTHGLSVRQFLLCVQLFYGELPSPNHIKEIVKEAETKVDQALKEMEITA